MVCYSDLTLTVSRFLAQTNDSPENIESSIIHSVRTPSPFSMSHVERSREGQGVRVQTTSAVMSTRILSNHSDVGV